MKNKWFNLRLFWDGVCQNKWIGIGGCVLGMLLIVGKYASEDGLVDPFVWFTAVLTAVMTLHLFHFLNTREGSDFYCALSNRTGLYVSYGLSILAWMLVMQLLMLGAEYIAHEVGMSMDAMVIKTLSTRLMLEAATGVLTLGIVLLAKGLTGTTFSNIIAALVIAFVPRFFVHILLEGVTNYFWILDMGQGWEHWMDSSHNVLLLWLNNEMDVFDSRFLYTVETNMVTYVEAFAYSTLLGIVYMTIGGVLFHRRKSETAGCSGISPRVQNVLRTAFLLVFTMCGSLELVYYVFGSVPVQNRLRTAMILYGIGLFLYFFAEYLMQRKLQLVKDCRWLALVVALNVALILGLHVTSEYLIAHIPKAQDIDGIRIVKNQEWIEELPTYESQVQTILSSVEIQEERIKRMVTDELEQAARAMQSHEYEISALEPLTLEIRQGTKKSYYKIEFTKEQRSQIRKAQGAAADQQEYTVVLPTYDMEKKDEYGNESYGVCTISKINLEQKEITELQQTLANEMKTHGVATSDYLGIDYSQNPDVFEVLKYSGADGSFVEVPISIETPKTLELLATTVNKEHPFKFYQDFVYGILPIEVRNNFADARAFVLLYDQEKKVGREVATTGCWEDKLNQMSDEEFLKLAEILSKEQTEISADEHLMYFSFRAMNGFYATGDALYLDEERAGHWYNLTDEELEFMRSLFTFEISEVNF